MLQRQIVLERMQSYIPSHLHSCSIPHPFPEHVVCSTSIHPALSPGNHTATTPPGQLQKCPKNLNATKARLLSHAFSAPSEPSAVHLLLSISVPPWSPSSLYSFQIARIPPLPPRLLRALRALRGSPSSLPEFELAASPFTESWPQSRSFPEADHDSA